VTSLRLTSKRLGLVAGAVVVLAGALVATMVRSETRAGAPAGPVIPWVLAETGAGERSLVVVYESGGCDSPDIQGSATETATTVTVVVRRQYPTPAGACPAIARIGRGRSRCLGRSPGAESSARTARPGTASDSSGAATTILCSSRGWRALRHPMLGKPSRTGLFVPISAMTVQGWGCLELSRSARRPSRPCAARASCARRSPEEAAGRGVDCACGPTGAADRGPDVLTQGRRCRGMARSGRRDVDAAGTGPE